MAGTFMLLYEGPALGPGSITQRRDVGEYVAAQIVLSGSPDLMVSIEGALGESGRKYVPEESHWTEIGQAEVGPYRLVGMVPTLLRLKVLQGTMTRAAGQFYVTPGVLPFAPKSITSGEVGSMIAAELGPVSENLTVAMEARTVATIADAGAVEAAQTVIVRDPARGGVFNRDADQTGGAIPGVRFQWNGTWYSRQRRKKEWRLTDLDIAGDHGGNAGAALLSLRPHLTGGDRIIIPEGNYLLKGGEPLLFNGIPGLTIEGYGATLTFDETLPPDLIHAGFQFFNMTDLAVRGLTIDGRLDVRTPLGGDGGAVNFINNIAVLPGCNGVLLEDVTSRRSMMDGFYVGHSTAWLEGLAPNVEGNWPKDVTLNRCYAYDNYRQGLTVTCGYGGAVYGGEYSRSGALGGGTRGTPPRAGIDLESESRPDLGWGVFDWKISGATVRENTGYGIMLDTEVHNAIVENCTVEDNTYTGITTSDDAFDCTLINNRLKGNGVPLVNDLPELMLLGPRNRALNNTIRCQSGTWAISAPGSGTGRQIIGNICIADQPHGNQGTAALIVEGSNDTVVNNTVIGGYQSVAFYGVLRVASAGGTALGNRVIDPNGGNPAVPWVLECATERDNLTSGYTGGKYVTVTAKPATPGDTAAYSYTEFVPSTAYNGLLDEVRAMKQAMKQGGITT